MAFKLNATSVCNIVWQETFTATVNSDAQIASLEEMYDAQDYARQYAVCQPPPSAPAVQTETENVCVPGIGCVPKLNEGDLKEHVCGGAIAVPEPPQFIRLTACGTHQVFCSGGRCPFPPVVSTFTQNN